MQWEPLLDDVQKLLADAARLRDELRSREAAFAFERAAGMLRATGRHAEAVAVLKDLVELQPTRAAHYRLEIGEALASEGLTGEAVEWMEALARDLARDDRHEEVAGVRESLCRVDPSVGRVVAFGRAAVTARAAGRALAALQRAYRDDPARLDVLELLSWAFESAGERAKADAIRAELAGRYRAALGTAATRNADSESDRDGTRTRINEFLRYSRELRHPALDLATEMAARNPLAVDARRTLGTVRALFGDKDGAAYEFLAAIELALATGNAELAEEIRAEARGLS